MRGEGQDQAERDVERAIATETVGVPFPRASASATDDSPALGIRSRLTLTVAAVFAIAAIAAVVALTWHANAARDNEDRLDDVIVNINGLQDAPWRLQSANVAGGQLSAADLHAKVAATERRITSQLATLQREAPSDGIAAARPPLMRNFAALTEAIDFIKSKDPSKVWLVAAAVFQSHDAVLAALDRARAHDHSAAEGRLWEATIGSIVVMALLLGGFAVFYWRSLKARKSAEALATELELSRQHLEHAQRVVRVGSWEWNDRDRILRWSPEQARLHGWYDAEPPSDPKDFLALIAPDDRGRVRSALREIFVEGKSMEFEYRVAESRGGRLIRVQATNSIEADGRRRLIGTSQDMTERFRRVEAERANRAKNEFISRMSHELRTPLNAVLGFGQLMSMSDLDERQQGNVQHILSAGRHLLDLINEILDISRIESGDMRLSLESVSLGSVIVDSVDLITPVASEHRIILSLDEEPGLWVRADAQRLRQVLLNLLSNAVKYNDDGGHVWVRTHTDDADGGRVRIEVQDDGAGIAPEMMERLFSPFERLGAEQSAVEGTGLGLAVSRGMIEAMGGRISVRSAPGEGSTFTIELSAASAPAARETSLRETVSSPAMARHGSPTVARRNGTSPPVSRQNGVSPVPRERGASAAALTVLCIEDNAANIELIEQILTDRPEVRLLGAQDGGSGLRLAHNERPHLVLLDLDLPDITGEQVLRELRNDPATAGIRVVILSARTADEQAERLLELGAQSYITKPPGVTALLHAVDAADPERSVA